VAIYHFCTPLAANCQGDRCLTFLCKTKAYTNSITLKAGNNKTRADAAEPTANPT